MSLAEYFSARITPAGWRVRNSLFHRVQSEVPSFPWIAENNEKSSSQIDSARTKASNSDCPPPCLFFSKCSNAFFNHRSSSVRRRDNSPFPRPRRLEARHPGGQGALLHQPIGTQQERISAKGRPCLVRRIFFPCRADRKHLPPTLSTLNQKIRKGSCRWPQIADGIGVGKGGWMEQYPGGSLAHTETPPESDSCFHAIT